MNLQIAYMTKFKGRVFSNNVFRAQYSLLDNSEYTCDITIEISEFGQTFTCTRDI